MKQRRLILALAATAVLLCGVFFVVEHFTKVRKERQEIGEGKQLFSIDSTKVTRITLDNEDGQLEFDWDSEQKTWVLGGSEKFDLNTYAVDAICNYFCNLSSLKTVSFDCADTSVYGFDNPIVLKLYTTETGEEHPYIISVGDNTPTYDGYYVMIDGSNDVYTVDYTTGSIFCASKETLKNTYLMDAYGTSITYYKVEREGKTVMELTRNADLTWNLVAPRSFPVQKANVDSLIETVVRATISRYVQDDAPDLAKYGLEKPHTILTIRSSDGRDKVILFGSAISDSEMYGYFQNTNEVFVISNGEAAFLDNPLDNYVLPYLVDIEVDEVESIAVNLQDICKVQTTLSIDSEKEQYSIDGKSIDTEKDALLEAYQTFYRAVSNLEFSDLDLEGNPGKEEAGSIVYHLRDGTTRTVSFIPEAENRYWVNVDGTYTGMTVRLNRFTAAAGIVKSYEALQEELK